MIALLAPRTTYMIYQLLRFDGSVLAEGTRGQVIDAIEKHYTVTLDHGYDGELLVDGEVVAFIRPKPSDDVGDVLD